MPDRVASKQRPYLIRAMHEWMVDNDLTPHIVAAANSDALVVPRRHVKDGKIILNVSYTATDSLQLGNEEIRFEARFGGVGQRVSIPVDAILGIYARETGQGMVFTDETSPAEPESPAPIKTESGRPQLKVIK